MVECSQHFRIRAVVPWIIKGFLKISLEPVIPIEIPDQIPSTINNPPFHIEKSGDFPQGMMMMIQKEIPNMMNNAMNRTTRDETHFVKIMKEEDFYNMNWRIGDHLMISLEIATKREKVKPAAELTG